MDNNHNQYSGDRITMLYDVIPFIALLAYWYVCYKVFGIW